ncbi:MAG: Cof-type HAD-IIB family hydrolase [Acidobacteria bacterium]|nr:MAG: Cof-type HAD-IIB family hydrolase [Acidobacteriota bacterium]
MTIRLIALDLDGTLLNSRGELSGRNRAAIESARGRGVSVALVTGRRFRDARPLALELGLDVPVIAHNGALTKHALTLETVNAILMPVGAARAVVRLGRAHGADALVSDDHVGAGLLVYDHITEGNTALAKYIAWSRRVVGETAAQAIRRVPSLEEYLNHDPLHVAFSGGCAAMERLAEVMRRELGASVKLLLTLYPKTDFALLDILHPDASKGAGLAAVAAEQGLVREEVMAVGDNFNDLEMLEWAGTGVIMGNAEPALLERGHFHATASNDEDGVADAIERFVLQEQETEVRSRESEEKLLHSDS